MSRPFGMLSSMILSVATLVGGAALIAFAGCEDVAPPSATAAHADAITLDFDVKGMSCEGCVFAVRSAIVDLDGVEACEVLLADERAVVTVKDSGVEGQIIEAVEKLDFTITLRSMADAAVDPD